MCMRMCLVRNEPYRKCRKCHMHIYTACVRVYLRYMYAYVYVIHASLRQHRTALMPPFIIGYRE